MTLLINRYRHVAETTRPTLIGRAAPELRVLHIKSLWVRGGGIEKQILGLINSSIDGETVHHVAQLVPPAPIRYGAELVQSDVLTETSVGDGRLHTVAWDRPRLLLPSFSHLRGLIPRHGIDILHCHDNRANLLGSLLSAWCDVPMVASLYGYVDTSWKLRALALFDRQLLRSADHIIASSSAMLRCVPSVCSSRVTTILNAIDVTPCEMSAIQQREWKRRFKVEDAETIVTVVGRLSHEKGHHILLAAVPAVLRHFPRTRFLLIGDGPLRRQLERKIEVAGMAPYVRLAGFVDDARAAMCCSDVIVQPSLSESLPLTVLEAMVQGKAIVATDVGSVREAVVEGETGFLVQPNDPVALARAIIAMLEDSPRRTEMGERGAILVRERFSIETRGALVQKVYQRTLDLRRLRRTTER